MKMEPWVIEFIRKIPRNYLGEVVIRFDRPGEVTAIHRNDVWTRDLFYQRFKELGPLPVEGDTNGHESYASDLAHSRNE